MHIYASTAILKLFPLPGVPSSEIYLSNVPHPLFQVKCPLFINPSLIPANEKSSIL